MNDKPIKLLFASDSFKGSLTSLQTAMLLEKAADEVFGRCECKSVAVADGGEGTVDAVVSAVSGKTVSADVHDPLMKRISASYGLLDDNRAIIEMASASGLTLVPENLRNPLNTTTYGTGELILHALDNGCRDITVAIGGSATNDGGMGCMRALGVRFLDFPGNELECFGRDLEKVDYIDTDNIDKRLGSCRITVMCDVRNPLCGENGAARNFAAQKGADKKTVARLESGMQNYREVIKRRFNIDCDSVEGAGAAGGLGAALKVFCSGEMRAGVDTVLDLIDFDSLLEGVDLVVTGEGRADWQSAFGKVMSGVGKRAKAKGIPAIGLCGSLGKGAENIFSCGISSLITTVNAPMTLDIAIENAQGLYYDAAVRMFRLIKAGMTVREGREESEH